MSIGMELRFERLQVFTWTEPDGTEHKWLVLAAQELIRARGLKPQPAITLAVAQDALNCNENAPPLDPRNVAKADLNEPIVLVTVWHKVERGWRHIIIDGWHRVTKMVLLGRTEPLWCYILDKDDSLAVSLTPESERQGICESP